MLIFIFTFITISLSVINLQAAPLGDCSAESPNLSTVMCEPFEVEDWYTHGFVRDGGLDARPAEISQLDRVSITNQGCKSGNCLKVKMLKHTTRSLSVHWPLKNAGLEPEELNFRYYLKLGSDFSANACDPESGEEVEPYLSNGKFPGIGDPRSGADPGGQCGNGGAKSDGIQCWMGRGLFQKCLTNMLSSNYPYDSTCGDNPDAALKMGHYLYAPEQDGNYGINAFWDHFPYGNQFGGGRATNGQVCYRGDINDPNCYCNKSSNYYCGKEEHGILVRNKWYHIEMRSKMNTPGQANGIMQAWVNGQLAYDKNDVLYRNIGHQNLHARLVWLNIYKGGTKGNCETGHLYIDQMVISKKYIGEIESAPSSNLPPKAPNNLIVQ